MRKENEKRYRFAVFFKKISNVYRSDLISYIRIDTPGGWHMKLNDIFLSASIEINLTVGNVLSSVLRYSFINNGNRISVLFLCHGIQSEFESEYMDSILKCLTPRLLNVGLIIWYLTPNRVWNQDFEPNFFIILLQLVKRFVTNVIGRKLKSDQITSASTTPLKLYGDNLTFISIIKSHTLGSSMFIINRSQRKNRALKTITLD